MAANTVEKEVLLEGIENPIGTDGFEFIEFATTKPDELYKTFETFGFQVKGTHPSRKLTLMAQDGTRLIINSEPESYAYQYAQKHGHSMVSQGYKVKDAKHAFEEAVRRGATPFESWLKKDGDLNLPAIYGVGDALIYFVDDEGMKTLYEKDYVPNPNYDPNKEIGLNFIDHLDHNVDKGHLAKYEKFYKEVFNFQEVRYWDLKGKETGINSMAFLSPCGKILIPVVQSSVGNSYVQEYVDLYHGEGIQHIAFYCNDICKTIETLRSRGQTFSE